MPLTISNVTTANSTTAGPTLALTGITAAVGEWLVLAVAADNNGPAGASSTSASITDAAGNTWTQRASTNYTPGATAADGTTVSIWTCVVTHALSSATITVNFSPDTTAKAAVLKKASPGSGEVITFDAVGAGVTATGTTFSAGAVSVNVGHTIFGWTGLENNSAPTADSDTTNGSWSTAQTATASTGTSTTSQSISGQHKTVTATGSQTYDTTGGATRDGAANYLILFFDISAAGTSAGIAAASAAPLVAGASAGTATASAAVQISGVASGAATAIAEGSIKGDAVGAGRATAEAAIAGAANGSAVGAGMIMASGGARGRSVVRGEPVLDLLPAFPAPLGSIPAAAAPSFASLGADRR